MSLYLEQEGLLLGTGYMEGSTFIPCLSILRTSGPGVGTGFQKEAPFTPPFSERRKSVLRLSRMSLDGSEKRFLFWEPHAGRTEMHLRGEDLGHTSEVKSRWLRKSRKVWRTSNSFLQQKYDDLIQNLIIIDLLWNSFKIRNVTAEL